MAAVLHCHLCYLYRNVVTADARMAATLLIGQCVLKTHFRLDDATGQQAQQRSAFSEIESPLGVPHTELFDLFQAHRCRMVQWLRDNPGSCSEVMEAVVRVLTHTGGRAGIKRKSERPADVPDHRRWQSMERTNCIGRFVPDTEAQDADFEGAEGAEIATATSSTSAAEPLDAAATFEQWLRAATLQVGTEINAQLGEFTLKRHQLQLLGDWANEYEDFVSRFGNVSASNAMHCAEVRNTTNRSWVRLMGRRHDLQRWVPDERPPALPVDFHRRYPRDLRPGERWVTEILEPWRQRQQPLQIALCLSEQEDASGSNSVRLAGLFVHGEGGGGRKGQWEETVMLREIVVHRHPPLVEVFNIVEHGRRFYPNLVWSSDGSRSLAEVRPAEVQPDPVVFQTGVVRPTLAIGDLRKPAKPQPSLVILRNLSKQHGKQQLVPQRFLLGLLPMALLEEYEFWQNEDESLTGYQPPGHWATTATPSILLIQFPPSSSGGFGDVVAQVTRVPVRYDRSLASATSGEPGTGVGSLPPTLADEDRTQPRLVLINLLRLRPEAPFSRFIPVLQRLDNLSHCLVWAPQGTPNVISRIEFPRIRLNFHAVHFAGTAQDELQCEEHTGLRFCQNRPHIVGDLLKGLPHAVLLDNTQGEAFLLVSSSAMPVKLEVKSGKLESRLFRSDALLVRNQPQWLENLPGARHYMLPIHLSGAFLFTPTLASALYLYIFCLLTGQYERAFLLADVCVTDTNLSPEEAQLWELLDAVCDDATPDAVACRLRLTAATLGCTSLTPPWSIVHELDAYVAKRSFVSVYCRLTPQEELILLKECVDDSTLRKSTTQQVFARCQLVAALIDAKKAVAVELPPCAPVALCDREFDRSCAEADNGAWTSAGVTYSRCNADALTGVRGMEFLARIQRTWNWRTFGFMFVYELLTASLPVKIHSDDQPHNWGCAIVRLIETEAGPHGSLLRTLASNPALAEAMPRYSDPKCKADFRWILRQISRALEENKGKTAWPTVYPPADPPTSLELDPAHIAWATTRVTRYGCSRRAFLPSEALLGKSETDDANPLALALAPLESIGIAAFVEHRTRSELGLAPLEPKLPFSLGQHTSARSVAAQAILHRLQEDITGFAEDENKRATPHLLGLQPSAISSESGATRASESVRTLVDAMQRQKQRDELFVRSAIPQLLQTVNRGGVESDLARICGYLPTVSFEHLSALLLNEESDVALLRWNPTLSPDALQHIYVMLATIMLRVNRIGHTTRSIGLALDLIKSLEGLAKAPPSEGVVRATLAKASLVAQAVACRRHYVEKKDISAQDCVLEYDPRLLVFEFAHNLVLRESQVRLIRQITAAASSGKSACHQMLMGQGKTTVVAPLLALLLGSSERLVTQIVPHALLEFSRAVMRERFSAIIRKPVYTFNFDRATHASPALVQKLVRAREAQAVVCANPTAVKSLMLSLIEAIHEVDQTRVVKQQEGPEKVGLFARVAQALGRNNVASAKIAEAAEKARRKERITLTVRVLEMFRSSVLLLDEVDMLLHPLRSELHWPLGTKEPLDLTVALETATATPGGFNTSAASEAGLRWQLPAHLLEALLYAMGSGGPSVLRFQDSREAMLQLRKLQEVIGSGAERKLLQRTPHLVLLSASYYHDEIRPILAQWMLLWLRSKRLTGVSDGAILNYLLAGSPTSGNSKFAAAQSAVKGIPDTYMRLLNLAREWLHSLLPHVLSKVNRVGFGLLSEEQLEKISQSNPRMPQSRKILAIPFLGKDVPSRASEFSHPDIVLGLTNLAYRYDGLRRHDFGKVIELLQQSMEDEDGAYHKRPTVKRFVEWVELAGGHVRGTPRRKLPPAFSALKGEDAPSEDKSRSLDGEADPFDDIWSLELLDRRDTEQMEVVYQLLRRSAFAIELYLHEIVFPATTTHAGVQLTATAQDLGGDMLFQTRVGFSGTPSDLLPEELGRCNYQRGDDAKMLLVLTDPANITYGELGGWSVLEVLRHVATANPPFHALIDTGALVTGMSNEQVAAALLDLGLADMDGVVYLDSEDRQMVLLRDGRKSVRLAQSGLDPQRRFTFYDQVHTTGMDIRQAVGAVAALTLGKDMCFRDYAQGAYRMRGLGQGQRIHLIVIPEVARLIATQIRGGATSPLPSDTAGYLKDVCAWLVLSGMRSENLQFSLLCEQSLCNIWRKQAFHGLSRTYQLLFTDGQNSFLERSIEVFRERVDYAIPNVPPQAPQRSERLLAEIAEHECFLLGESDSTLASSLVHRATPTADEKPEEVDPEEATAAAGQAFEGEQEQEEEEEQEQEQEEEKEQEKEREEECEDETEPEAFARQKYSREEEQPLQWPLQVLQRGPGAACSGSSMVPFYSAAEFGVFRGMLKRPTTMPFPPFLLLSNNYFSKAWSVKSLRRIKNVIILLEWVPDWNELRLVSDEGTPADQQKGLNAEQLDLLRQSFDLFDGDGKGALSIAEVRELLLAVDVNEDQVANFLEKSAKTGETDTETDAIGQPRKERLFTFDDIRDAVAKHSYYEVQRGRYFVALSLAEAETLRGVLHAYRNEQLFGSGARTGLRLWTVAPLRALDDASRSPSEAMQTPEYQLLTAHQSARYLDSETSYSTRQLHCLLRVLQSAECRYRERFFTAVRQCRRRKLVPWQITSLAPLFTTADEYHVLQNKAIIARLQALLRSKGLWARDAFQLFDTDHDGLLRERELARGLEWLGLRNAHFPQVAAALGLSKYGALTLEDFKTHLGAADEEASNPAAATVGIDGYATPILEPDTEADEVRSETPDALLSPVVTPARAPGPQRRFDIRLRPIGTFVETWNSLGTMARSKCSVWAPDNLQAWKRSTRVAICTGFYAHADFSVPQNPKARPLYSTIEVVDRSNFLRSEVLMEMIERTFPRPVRFTQVWAKQRGRTPLYCWAPVAPPGFVSLGHVVTKYAEDPPLDIVRCVPREWVRPVQKPNRVWDDRGTAGRPGSAWAGGSLGLVVFTQGHDAPAEPQWDLSEERPQHLS
eukprot:TRINITY_DN11719_c0_g1_i1.p1 TRINITY_DN11719_c0_g1~~TRINITY_DN11719_c0_g1_i1.p1  ORF type:complete len:3283 (+),score=530.28 TRINITY_DN11719_c0_g1_i1:870-9851(+)